MATGDVLIFDEAMAYMLDGGWEAAENINCAILDNTLTPVVGATTPSLTDYTEVGIAGTYSAGGTLLGTWGSLITQTSGVTKFDSGVNPTWAQHASNDIDAWWGLIYNVTTAEAIGFVELGGPVDMKAGDLTITWAAGGIFTIT